MIRRLKTQALVEGLITFLPKCANLLTSKTTGTDSAKYCYAVWLRHEVKTRPHRSGDLINTIVELGPGDSLGIGLASLIASAKKYIAIDVIKYADQEKNLLILNELKHLFQNRTAIPDLNEFPEIKPHLESYQFPSWLTCCSTDLSFNDHVHSLQNALSHINSSTSPIAYASPENAFESISENSIDFIFSQAVLEHVDDIDAVYRNCYKWLAPGGLMSHQIDFKSHGMALTWDGHWTYSPLVWQMIRGRRPYLINRKPCSVHLNKMLNCGFEIVELEHFKMASTLKHRHLAHRFRSMSPEDLTTAGAYIIARKPAVQLKQPHPKRSADKKGGNKTCVE